MKHRKFNKEKVYWYLVKAQMKNIKLCRKKKQNIKH